MELFEETFNDIIEYNLYSDNRREENIEIIPITIIPKLNGKLLIFYTREMIIK